MLNDPMTQKKLGAFYTPALYAKLGLNLVKKAVERAMGGGGRPTMLLSIDAQAVGIWSKNLMMNY
ncbi:hypothetical protein [Campylobacter helveticus]|uniref:hypothetical protein n=1 Tax=Campylobacter helveticus TaxID=28898 RepID=UPI0022EAFA7A|nr:hypothetical protein [Campylobacter helveticus]